MSNMLVESLNLPNNVSDLHAIVIDLHERINDGEQRYEQTYKKYEQVEKENKLLRERIKLLTLKIYGVKSEKYKPTSIDSELSLSQRLLFELELGEELESVEINKEKGVEEVEINSYKRKKPGRKRLPPDLPRKEIIHDLAEEDKIHSCGLKMEVIGEERTEKLQMEPAKFWVEVHVRLKYGCKCQGVDGDDGDGSVRLAPGPVQLIPKSFATASLISHILTAKFCDALPFYRQEKQFSRLGIELGRATMCNWSMKIFDRCRIVDELLIKELHSGYLILIDETPFQVICEEGEGRSASTKSYMWVARGGPPDRQVVYFRYSPTRSGGVAADLLRGFAGYVGTDGYSGYDFLDRVKEVIHFGCWSHGRRKFFDVVKSAGKRKKLGKVDEILILIRKLYKVESKADDLALSAEDRLSLRQDESRPIVDKIKKFLDDISPRVLPESLFGKAVGYMVNQWPRLIHFLNDGRIPLDTNRIENDIRPFVVGRKNWLFNYHAEGARASAFYYTILETARTNGLEPFSYLRYLFEHIPLAVTEEDFKKLLPQYVDKTLIVKC